MVLPSVTLFTLYEVKFTEIDLAWRGCQAQIADDRII